jgi:hypothetical protein
MFVPELRWDALRTQMHDQSSLFTHHASSLHSAHAQVQGEMLGCRLYKVLTTTIQ